MAGKRKGLGKGLDALLGAGIGTQSSATGTGSSESGAAGLEGRLAHLPVELVQRGRYQPRRDMHQDALEELAASIRSQGVMQPIVVRPISDEKYEIIAGERRWRDRKSTRLNSSHVAISYAVFCL